MCGNEKATVGTESEKAWVIIMDYFKNYLKTTKINGISLWNMTIHKQIIVDGNIEGLIPLLKKFKVKNVGGLESLGLGIDADNKAVAKKLDFLGNAKKGYLFITKNRKDLEKVLTKRFDIIITPYRPSEKLALTIKGLLFCSIHSPGGWIWVAQKTRAKQSAYFNISPRFCTKR